MQSRKESEPDDSTDFSAEWEPDDDEMEEVELEDEIELEDALEQRRDTGSSKKACAARRSIERYQERRRLRAWLTEVFDDDLELELSKDAGDD